MKKVTSKVAVVFALIGVIAYCGKKADKPLQVEASLGQLKFEEVCASCHGLNGEGDGPAGAALTPKPRNFITEPFKFGDSLEAVENTIRKGSEGTGMVAYDSVFSKEEIDALAAYVLKLRSQGNMSGMSGMEGMSGMSGMSGMEGKQQGMSGMSGMSGMEGKQQGMSGMSGMSGMEGKQQGMSGMSGMSGMEGKKK